MEVSPPFNLKLMSEQKTIINQGTLIPISLMIVIVAAIATPIGMFFQLQALNSSFSEFKNDVKGQIEELRKAGSTTIYSDYSGITNFCREFVKTIK